MAPPNSGNHQENHRTSPEPEPLNIINFILRLILQLYEAQQIYQDFQERQMMINHEIMNQLNSQQAREEEHSSEAQPPSPPPLSNHNYHPPESSSARRGLCWECGENGHKRNNCPRLLRMSLSQHPSFKKPGTSQTTTALKKCYRCGNTGHIRKYCPHPFPIAGQVVSGIILIT